MLVRVLIFGPLRQELGDVIAVELPARATVATVNAALAEKYPQRAEFFRSARLAVNSAFGAANQPVKEGDEVALIELVSGG